MSIEKLAFKEAVEQLAAEWDSLRCPVCGESKWASYPFCRSCTLRTRVVGGLDMRPGYSFKQIQAFEEQSEGWLQFWAMRYDRMRDYLITTRRVGIRVFRRGISEGDDG